VKNSLGWRILIHAILIFASIACILPFVLLIVSSFTAEKEILRHGYSFFPSNLSLEAYKYLWVHMDEIGRAYGITILATTAGTAVGLCLMALLAYPLSRKDFPCRNVISFFVFFTMLFSGGLVPTYLLYTQILHIKNTIFALIVPGLLMNAFNVLLMKTFFANSIPMAVIESARIDGAGEFRTFVSIVLPLSLPILATVGLFQALGYWNDWYNGLIYLTDERLFSIQNILNRIINDIQFLANSNLGSNAGEAYAKIPSATVRMAIAVIGVVPILAVYPFFQKYFVKGIAIGAVKG
jgi:putative aldouronate transport system permease protein